MIMDHFRYGLILPVDLEAIQNFARKIQLFQTRFLTRSLHSSFTIKSLDLQLNISILCRLPAIKV